ncbi:hypothetical protein BJ508DRAFT_314501 [Ascobolus immersus RN42]|uniref:Uncharacterized protein n=1 Tax=Ascobolus immersus RN42 TaxID=1160509 RepID=A0A3N4HET9_ASCIM|nr:hypothetical protein BJ508DRAFT_314501 [Ascobolus immersus RN42]
MRFSATKLFFLSFLVAFDVQGRAINADLSTQDSDAPIAQLLTRAPGPKGLFLPTGYPNPTSVQMDKFMTKLPHEDAMAPKSVKNVTPFPALKGKGLGTERVNTAVYRPLGPNAFRIGFKDIKGCTSLVIVSDTAVYMAHYWEGSFATNDADLKGTDFEGAKGFKKLVLDGLTGPAPQRQVALTPNAKSFGAGAKGFLIHPKKADEPKNQKAYDEGIASIKATVKKILPSLPLDVVTYDPLGDVPDPELAKLPNDAARELAKAKAEKEAAATWNSRAFGDVMFVYGGSGPEGLKVTTEKGYYAPKTVTLTNRAYLFVEHREVFPTLKPAVTVKP